jgi:hypothetical protein
MIVSIKDIMVDVKTFNGTMYISESDIFRIINRKVRTKRGKSMSKDKVADYTLPGFKLNNQMYYVLLLSFDDCYHNNMLKTVNYKD